MVWGGSLNKRGTEYLKQISEAERAIKFLENLKKELDDNQKEKISNTIELIMNFFSSLTEKE